MSKPLHVIVKCRLPEMEEELDRMDADHDVVALSTHQCGTGFGSYVEAVIVFKRRPQVGRPPKEKNNGAGLDRQYATNGAH